MRLWLFVPLIFLGGCAELHHVQLGDVDARGAVATRKVDVKLSDTGVNLQEAHYIVRELGDKAWRESSRNVFDGVALFQMGPRTGGLVYNSAYARSAFDRLYESCPSGDISNLLLVREARRYPVISGEIVKISGDCRN